MLPRAIQCYYGLMQQSFEEEILSYIEEAEESLAPILYRSVLSMFDGYEIELDDEQYSEATMEYNRRQMELAFSFIEDLPRDSLRHHTIHCVSFRESLRTVIGLNLTQFGRLLALLREPLAHAFPQSPELLHAGEQHRCGERRFKLFLCLFRLKQGATFAQMQLVFGWSESVLQEWFQLTLNVLELHLRSFHKGFLTYMGAEWQNYECTKWRHKHTMDGFIDSYDQKVIFQNNELRRSGLAPSINPTHFIGSIGALDGTYCIQPQFGRTTLIAAHVDPTLDVMYTGYKKCHAYKVLIVSSHGLANEPKFLLWVEAACGSASDAAVLTSINDKLDRLLVPEAGMLGDHAFHGSRRVIAGYTTAQVNATIHENRGAFNHNHSSDRMTSEHGVRSLKIWGVVRGRNDSFLFSNDENFKKALRVVWGLHNYIACDCPEVL